jgi:hypothetical protein
MKEASSILDEINGLYRELFELESGESKINDEDPMKKMKTAKFENLEPLPIDSMIRHDEIMSRIMQLTHEYTQIIIHKT